MIKLICDNCGSKISKIGVCVEDFKYRTDYECVDGSLVRIDREYYDGLVNKIIYNCTKCGEVIVNKSLIRNLDDFVRDMENTLALPEEDLKANNYGPIIVERKND